MSKEGRKEGTRAQDVRSICCRHNKKLASFSWAKGECSGRRSNYLPNDVHEVDAKERKKKKDGLEGGEGGGKSTRDLCSLDSGSSLDVSIGRISRFALPGGGDDFLG